MTVVSLLLMAPNRLAQLSDLPSLQIAHLLRLIPILHGNAAGLHTMALVAEGLVHPAANTGCSCIDADGALRGLGCLEEDGALLRAAVAAHCRVRLSLNVCQRPLRLRESPSVSGQKGHDGCDSQGPYLHAKDRLRTPTP